MFALPLKKKALDPQKKMKVKGRGRGRGKGRGFRSATTMGGYYCSRLLGALQPAMVCLSSSPPSSSFSFPAAACLKSRSPKVDNFRDFKKNSIEALRLFCLFQPDLCCFVRSGQNNPIQAEIGQNDRNKPDCFFEIFPRDILFRFWPNSTLFRPEWNRIDNNGICTLHLCTTT